MVALNTVAPLHMVATIRTECDNTIPKGKLIHLGHTP